MDFNYFKEKWNYFAETALWILTIAGTFIVSPPLLSLDSSFPVEPFTRFIVAGLLALLFIPIRKYSQPAHYRFWFRVATISFLLSIVLTFTYNIASNAWSVNEYGKVLVTGKTMFPEAANDRKEFAAKRNRSTVDDQSFVRARGGDTQSIWPMSEIRPRFYILLAAYIVCVLSIGFFLISVIQSIYCYEMGTKTD